MLHFFQKLFYFGNETKAFLKFDKPKIQKANYFGNI